MELVTLMEQLAKMELFWVQGAACECGRDFEAAELGLDKWPCIATSRALRLSLPSPCCEESRLLWASPERVESLSLGSGTDTFVLACPGELLEEGV